MMSVAIHEKTMRLDSGSMRLTLFRWQRLLQGLRPSPVMALDFLGGMAGVAVGVALDHLSHARCPSPSRGSRLPGLGAADQRPERRHGRLHRPHRARLGLQLSCARPPGKRPFRCPLGGADTESGRLVVTPVIPDQHPQHTQATPIRGRSRQLAARSDIDSPAAVPVTAPSRPPGPTTPGRSHSSLASRSVGNSRTPTVADRRTHRQLATSRR
jgi:hypothetical protein